MQRRDFFKGLLAAPAMSAAAADDYQGRTKGLPPLTIKDVKVITTSAGRNYRWVFLKIITSEPGLYGIGSANDSYQTQAVIAALEKHRQRSRPHRGPLAERPPAHLLAQRSRQ